MLKTPKKKKKREEKETACIVSLLLLHLLWRDGLHRRRAGEQAGGAGAAGGNRADGGPWRRICALPALWVGLLYDQEQLDLASDWVNDWTLEEHEHLRTAVPKYGLSTPFRGQKVRELALQMLAMARAGLEKRARRAASASRPAATAIAALVRR